MTGDDRPSLSVVIAATDSPLAVDRALGVLQGQVTGWVEVIVCGIGSVSIARHPSVRWIPAPPGTGVPRLRWLGLEAARGRVVAFTEDNALVDLGWAEAWISAFKDPSLVAGSGTVGLDGPGSKLDRAVVFCEYAPFLPGGRMATPGRLAGNNFAILRDVALPQADGEVHEVSLLTSIRRVGNLVRLIEQARVQHVRRYGWGEAFADRIRFGFAFGRLRTVGARPLVRWFGLVAGPAIFASQVIRLASAVGSNPRHLGRFLQTLPLTLALLAAWSVGEWAGWSLGPPPPTSRRRRGTRGRTREPQPAPALSPRFGYKPGPPPA